MNPTELIKEGRLSEARGQLTANIRTSPTDMAARTLLFQVLAYLGEWDKAERHLEILTMQAPERASGVLLYRNLVNAEKTRAAVQNGKLIPDFMTDPPSYFQDFLDVREGFASGSTKKPADQLSRIESKLPSVRGTANGVPFEGFMECDATLFCFLEVFIHDRYLWFPFSSLRELSIRKPVSLLDLLWVPGRLVTWEGLTTDCYLPVLYPGSAGHEDELVRLGRVTDWRELGGGYFRGMGQHLLQVGEEEKGILELRDVAFKAPE